MGNGMIHPDTELRFASAEIGHGVFATRLIPKGTITWVGDALDQKFPPGTGAHLPSLLEEQLEKYSFRDSSGQRILCWDNARFVNHSCEANCLSADFDFELAIRDIQPGEELTDDYGTLNIESSFACLCGAAGCRGVIRPDDLLRFGRRWDAAVRDSLPALGTVPQPLSPLLAGKQTAERVLAGDLRLPSIATHYCGSCRVA